MYVTEDTLRALEQEIASLRGEKIAIEKRERHRVNIELRPVPLAKPVLKRARDEDARQPSGNGGEQPEKRLASSAAVAELKKDDSKEEGEVRQPKQATTEDPVRKKRDTNLLQRGLFGFLAKAKKDLESEAKKDAVLKKQEAERRAEEKTQRLQVNLDALRRREAEERKAEDHERYAEVQRDMRRKEKELLRRKLELHYSRMKNFIRTKAEPTIFFLPAKHNAATRELLQETENAIKVKIQSLSEFFASEGDGAAPSEVRTLEELGNKWRAYAKAGEAQSSGKGANGQHADAADGEHDGQEGEADTPMADAFEQQASGHRKVVIDDKPATRSPSPVARRLRSGSRSASPSPSLKEKLKGMRVPEGQGEDEKGKGKAVRRSSRSASRSATRAKVEAEAEDRSKETSTAKRVPRSPWSSKSRSSSPSRSRSRSKGAEDKKERGKTDRRGKASSSRSRSPSEKGRGKGKGKVKHRSIKTVDDVYALRVPDLKDELKALGADFSSRDRKETLQKQLISMLVLERS